MDYNELFSEDVRSFFRSPVREIFKKVDLNAIYSFAGGYPSAETFPMEEIRKTMSEVIDKYAGKAFQYGATQGVPELRQAVAERYGVSVERVQITSSSQQGIDVCTRILVDPGDVILTSNPSYLGALQSFKSYRADIRGIAHDDDLEAFRQSYETVIADVKAEGKTVKFLYMIPDFQNPSGESLTIEERQMLVSLSRTARTGNSATKVSIFRQCILWIRTESSIWDHSPRSSLLVSDLAGRLPILRFWIRSMSANSPLTSARRYLTNMLLQSSFQAEGLTRISVTA